MAVEPGEFGINGEYLHFVDGSKEEWRYHGQDLGTPPSGREKQELWVDGNQIHYVDEFGTYRALDNELDPSISQTHGSIWIESLGSRSRIVFISTANDTNEPHTNTATHDDTGKDYTDHSDHKDHDNHSDHQDSGKDFSDHSNSYHQDKYHSDDSSFKNEHTNKRINVGGHIDHTNDHTNKSIHNDHSNFKRRHNDETDHTDNHTDQTDHTDSLDHKHEFPHEDTHTDDSSHTDQYAEFVTDH